MYQARDARTGRLVSATQASGYVSYLCPLCNKPVFPRRGQVRSAHFAHMPGVGTRECELFIASENPEGPGRFVGGHGTSGARLSDQVAPLTLSITLEPEENVRRGHQRRWELCVTVPKSPDSSGQISFDGGVGSTRRISLSSLSVSALTFPVNTDAFDFGVTWTSPEVPPEYKVVVSHRMTGLARSRVSLFATTAAKYKPRVGVLSWGSNYYFVWNEALALVFPEQLNGYSLARRGLWNCALVSLPDEGDAETSAWLEQATGVSAIRERHAWGMIYPAPYNVDIAGRVQLAPAATIYLATLASGLTGEGSTVSATAGKENASITLASAGWRFIEIADTQQPVLRLRWDDHELPALVRTPRDAFRSSVVVIDFAGETEEPWRSEFHNVSCRSALAKARAGQIKITNVEFPSDVLGLLRFRRRDEFEVSSIGLAATVDRSRGVNFALPADDVGRLNTILRDSTCEVWIDFGAFGVFHAEPRPVAVDVAVPELKLSRETRERVDWLCKTAGAFQAAGKRPIGELTDDELAQHFSGLFVSTRLAAHWRSIEDAIRIAREER